MTSSTGGSVRILGSLESAEGSGVLRLEERLNSDIDDVWSALTDPGRLAGWYGDVEGDVQAGGTFRARLHASGWEGAMSVEACEPPRSFLIVGQDPDEPNEHSTEVTLTPSGDQTMLVVEQRGLPVDLLWAYGAGLQIHVEDLVAHVEGRERCDSKARFDELAPAYRELAADLGS